MTLVREDGFRVYHPLSASDPPGATRRATYGQPVAESLLHRLDHPAPSTGLMQASPRANARHLLAYGTVVHLHEVFAAGVGSGRVTEAALLLLDRDHVKAVNDTLGHHIGDRLLAEVGQRLRDASTAQAPLVARLGGDEFAILPEGRNGMTAAQPLAAVIVETLHRPFAIEGLQVSVGASIGVAYCPTDGEDSHALVRAADVAMYRAKRQALGIVVDDRRFDHYSTERLAFGSERVEALEQAQTRLHDQPKVAIAAGAVTGFEALVRWQHPRHGLFDPDAFLDRVEMSAVIHPLTEAVIETAVADKRRLARLGFDQPVAIKRSARNLVDTRCQGATVRQTRRGAGIGRVAPPSNSPQGPGLIAPRLCSRRDRSAATLAGSTPPYDVTRSL